MKSLIRVFCLALLPMMICAQEAPAVPETPAVPEATAVTKAAEAKSTFETAAKNAMHSALDVHVKEVINNIEAVKVAAKKLNEDADKLSGIAETAKDIRRKAAKSASEMTPISNMMQKLDDFTGTAGKLADAANDVEMAAELVLEDKKS